MKYKAFISYRHCQPDSAAARKIIKIVETYGIPKTIIEKHHTDKRVGKLFRDEDELSASANLSKSITDALDDSEYLIMLCSPEYIQSEWCMLEFNYWLEHKEKEKIIVVLLKGEPETAFPEKLTEEGEPLAIDIRGASEKDILRKIQNQKLRIVASLIGCDYDDLRQRDKEQARQTRMVSAGILLSLICAFSASIAYLQSKANYELNEKNIQIKENIVQISEQNKEINRKNDELETQNTEMKRLNANICMENAAFLAEKKLYDDAAKKVLEGYDLCSDLNDKQLIDKLIYTLTDYMCLYDADRQLSKVNSIAINELYATYDSKGNTLMCRRLDDLKFFDNRSGDMIYSSPESMLTNSLSSHLLSENCYLLVDRFSDTSSSSISTHNILDGSSASYEFNGNSSYIQDYYYDNDSITVLTDSTAFEFDFSCKLMGSYEYTLPEDFGIPKYYFILDDNDLLFVKSDRMLVYDIKNGEIRADIQGENYFFYNNILLENKDALPCFRPKLYGDLLFYTAMNTELDAPSLGAASISENKKYGTLDMNVSKNCRVASADNTNKLVFTTGGQVLIFFVGEDINSLTMRSYTISLTDDDYIKKAAVLGDIVAVMTGNGNVYLFAFDETDCQNYSVFEGTYQDVVLTDSGFILKGSYSILSANHTVDVYSYKLVENAAGYLNVPGKGTLDSSTNFDGKISLKRHARTHFTDCIFDADSCELIFSYENDNEDTSIYSGYTPIFSENNVITETPIMYSAFGADAENIIFWQEQFDKLSPAKADSSFSYKFNDGEYIYFLCRDGDERHGEKYSMSDGSLAEIIEFFSPYDNHNIRNYYLSDDIRIEILDNNEMFIYKNKIEKAKYTLEYGDFYWIDNDKIEFTYFDADYDSHAVIYSLSEMKEIFCIDNFNGSENTMYNANGTGCEYFLIANR